MLGNSLPLGKLLARFVLLVRFLSLLQEAVRHVRHLLVSIVTYPLQRQPVLSVLRDTLVLEVVRTSQHVLQVNTLFKGRPSVPTVALVLIRILLPEVVPLVQHRQDSIVRSSLPQRLDSNALLDIRVLAAMQIK